MELHRERLLASVEHAVMEVGSWWMALMKFEENLGKCFAALVLVAVAMVLARAQRLGLSWDMAYSIGRAFLQLSLIGFALRFIFQQEDVAGRFLILGTFCFMVVVAGLTAAQRAKGVPCATLIATVAIAVAGSVNLTLLVLLQVVEPTPRYLIPVAGMMIGNAMNATAIALKRLREDLKANVPLMEAALALGATPHQCVHLQVKRALHLALTPALDTTKTVGLVSLPGAMTGMIMGGAPPLDAARMQMVVMNFHIGCSAMSSMLAAFLARPRFFTSTQQILYESLT